MKKYIAFLLSGMLFLTACSASFDSGASVQENAAQSQETPLESSVALLASNTVAGETVSSLASQNQKTDTVPWQTDLPENHQMDPAVFSQLHTDLESSDVYAMVTVKDGVIIDEFYQDGYDENSVFQLNSCTKSFTGALIGIAIEQGYLGGVDDPLSDYLPQVLDLEDSGKQQITLRHLLTHTSGLEWYEWAGRSNWQEFRNISCVFLVQISTIPFIKSFLIKCPIMPWIAGIHCSTFLISV